MTRKDLYAQVKKLDLVSYIKTHYGKNFTNCTNDELSLAIQQHTNNCIVTSPLENKFRKLAFMLYYKKVISKKELESLID